MIIEKVYLFLSFSNFQIITTLLLFETFIYSQDVHSVFIVFCNSSKNRAACEPSIWAWWNWKEIGKVVLSQPLR